MRWALEHPGADEEIKLLKRFNQPIPEELQNPPQLHDVEYAIWRVFWRLNTERDVLVISTLETSKTHDRRLPWSVVDRYAKMSGIGAEAFHSIIEAMDEVYLAHKAGNTEGKKAFSRDLFKR